MSLAISKHQIGLGLVVGLAATIAATPFAKSLDDISRRVTDRTSLWHPVGHDILWNFRNMYNLHVIDEPGAEYPYRGWFFGWSVEDGNPGWPGCDAIFAARSKHLLDGWEVWKIGGGWDATMNPKLWAPVVTAQDKFYDQWHNGDPSVVKRGDTYYMAYSSVGFDKDGKVYGDPADTDGDYLCVMGAESTDGVHWRKSSLPIIFYGAQYGVTIPDGDGVLYGSYHRPSLMYDDGKWKLWFDYWLGPGPGVSMGYAENSGKFLDHWSWKIVRAGDKPALPQFPNPDVAKVGGVYFAYGDPPSLSNDMWRARKVTEAVSLNGVDWMVLGYVKALEGFPAMHVPEAFVVPQGKGRWRIYVFYACQIGGEPYNWRYDRVRAMWRDVTQAELDGYRTSLAAISGK
jgi:hypothetical protein